MKSTHQRARIVSGPFRDARLWVEISAPKIRSALSVDDSAVPDGGMYASTATIRCAVGGPNGGAMLLPPGFLELLPEFCTDPVPVEYAEWAHTERERLEAEQLCDS